MSPTSRRQFFLTAAAALATPSLAPGKVTLPMRTAFIDEGDFNILLARSNTERWHTLPIGQRIDKVAHALRGRPYVGFTLEIHDRIESPSVNFKGLDCWTFFEICLGFARMIGWRRKQHRPQDLLAEIERTRYRGGVCHGNYLDRIHYLAEWFFENEARGIATDITRELGGAQRMKGRKIQEMTILWKSYRYLRENPSLRAPMAESERKVAKLPVYYIPKSKVAAIEHKLKPGDIAGIVTHHDGGFCSHVGLITKLSSGKNHFFHASRDKKKVIVDSPLSQYLHRYKKHAGAIIARPLENANTITDTATYKRNLRKLGG